ncbi:MAG: hypothetical protein WCF85_19745 [Rhodospirillaceae bacterium]
MKIIAYLKDRLAEGTSRNVLTACLLSIGGSMAAGVPLADALYMAIGAGIVAAAGVLTPERPAPDTREAA